MRVLFFATLRPVVGGKEAYLHGVEGLTAREVLEKLFASYPTLREHILTTDGELQPYVNLFRNGRDLRWLRALDTPLSEEDDLAIFPPVAGGALSRSAGARGCFLGRSEGQL